MSTRLPSYDELPEAPGGGRHAWDLFGPEDSVGLLNLQTPDRVAAAARLVRTGRVFPLDTPVDFIDPPMYGRSLPVHTHTLSNPAWFDDRLDAYSLQAASQWDSLGHCAAEPGIFFGGATTEEVARGRRNTIDRWARRGIAGRGVLLDIPRALAAADVDYDPSTNRMITVDELEIARTAAGVEYQPGDVLLLRTGFLEWYAAQGRDRRTQVAHNPRSPGLDHSEAMARYLWDTHVSAVAADNPGVEADLPPGSGAPVCPHPFDVMHTVLIGRFGMALGEFWWLGDLAAECARDGVHEFFVSSAPLHVQGGIGSPANALAIR